MDLIHPGVTDAPRSIAVLLAAWLNYGSRRCGQAERWPDTMPAGRFDDPTAAWAGSDGPGRGDRTDAVTELRK